MVPAILTDDKCSPVVYKSGDTNGNGKVDPGEIWTFTCQYVVPGSMINTPTITNTASVKDPNLPTAPSFLGGDRDLSNNTDTCTVTITGGGDGYAAWRVVHVYAGRLGRTAAR